MGSYINHLEQLSVPNTLKRKKDYFRYNFSFIKFNPKTKVLEVGPGLGEFSDFLKDKKVVDITIIDNDKSVLNFVQKKNKSVKKILVSDISKINNKLEQYDFILLHQVLEHIPISKHKKLIQILYKHLNKLGKIVIVVPNANNPLGITERYADIQHVTAFTTQSLRDLINISNLEKSEITIKGYEIPPYSFVNIFRLLLQKILHVLLLLILLINGGSFFRIMTPNIMLVIIKK